MFTSQPEELLSKYSSRLSLKFTKDSYEKEYEKFCKSSVVTKNLNITSINILSSAFALIMCIIIALYDFHDVFITYFFYSAEEVCLNRKCNTPKTRFIISTTTMAVFDLFVLIFVKTKLCVVCTKDSVYCNNAIFFINYIFVGFSFHILAGILRSYFLSASDLLIFIQGISIIFRLVIIYYDTNSSWRFKSVSTLILIIAQIYLLTKMHRHVNPILNSYLINDSGFLVLMIGLAYIKENVDRLRFLSILKSKLVSDQLFDIINNIQQGIIIYRPRLGLKYVNKCAEGIFEKIRQSIFLGAKKGSLSMFSNNSSTNLSKEEKDFYLILEKKYEEDFINIFSKFKTVNQDLPTDYFNFFNRFTKNSNQEKFTIDELAKLIESNSNELKSFTKLGNINIDNANASSDFTDYAVQEFEVQIRNISLDEEVYTEFILSDISHIILKERKSTVNSCKANYLSKIAHEINNPLCSILELSDEVIRESNKMIDLEGNEVNLYKDDKDYKDIKEYKESKEAYEISMGSSLISAVNFDNISYCSKYISGICNFMNFLIQDFLLTSSFNEFCIVCEKTTAFCLVCLQNSKCVVCNMCDYCNKLKKNSTFNYNKTIQNCIKVFLTKNELEGNQIKIDTNLNSEEASQKINNCQDYFNSIIFNLYYHIYYKNKNFDMVINSKFTNQTGLHIEELSPSNLKYAGILIKGQYTFEIIETINLNLFKSSINSKIYTFEEYTKNKKISTDYEKLVHLYNAYVLARKLGSETLFIEVNEGGIKYSFNVKNHEVHGVFVNNRENTVKENSKFHLRPKKKLFSSIKNILKRTEKKRNQRTKSLNLESKESKKVRTNDAELLNDSREYCNDNKNKDNDKNTNSITFNIISNHNQPNNKEKKSKILKKINTAEDKLCKDYNLILDDEDIYKGNISSSSVENDNQSSFIGNEAILNDSESVKTEIFEDYKVTHLGSLKKFFKGLNFDNDDDDGKVTVMNVITNDIKPVKIEDNIKSGTSLEQNFKSDINNIVSNSHKYSKKRIMSAIKPNQSIRASKRLLGEENNTCSDINFVAEQYFMGNNESQVYRVLIADDERLIRNTINKFFFKYAQEYKLNIETVDCENGMEGLYILHKYYKNKKQFDLIITDETMPFMKGSLMINILSKLVADQSFYKITSISYTSYNDTEKMNYILSQGLDLIENKPITYTNFSKLMNNVLISKKI